jgi:hypothetical protein
MQAEVGGYIECINGPQLQSNPRVAFTGIVNEEGHLEGLSVNHRAIDLLHALKFQGAEHWSGFAGPLVLVLCTIDGEERGMTLEMADAIISLDAQLQGIQQNRVILPDILQSVPSVSDDDDDDEVDSDEDEDSDDEDDTNKDYWMAEEDDNDSEDK